MLEDPAGPKREVWPFPQGVRRPTGAPSRLVNENDRGARSDLASVDAIPIPDAAPVIGGRPSLSTRSFFPPRLSGAICLRRMLHDIRQGSSSPARSEPLPGFSGVSENWWAAGMCCQINGSGTDFPASASQRRATAGLSFFRRPVVSDAIGQRIMPKPALLFHRAVIVTAPVLPMCQHQSLHRRVERTLAIIRHRSEAIRSSP